MPALTRPVEHPATCSRAPKAPTALLTLALLLPPVTAPGAPPPANDTPRAAWLRAREAYRSGDFRAYVEGFTPSSRDDLLCEVAFYLGLSFGAGMFPERGPGEEVNGILVKHGAAALLGPEKPDPGAPGLHGKKAIRAIPEGEKTGLYADVMTWLRSHRVGPRVPAWLAADPAEVKVDGDRASIAGSPMSFERTGDRWLLVSRNRCLDDLFRDER